MLLQPVQLINMVPQYDSLISCPRGSQAGKCRATGLNIIHGHKSPS